MCKLSARVYLLVDVVGLLSLDGHLRETSMEVTVSEAQRALFSPSPSITVLMQACSRKEEKKGCTHKGKDRSNVNARRWAPSNYLFSSWSHPACMLARHVLSYHWLPGSPAGPVDQVHVVVLHVRVRPPGRAWPIRSSVWAALEAERAVAWLARHAFPCAPWSP